jgi:hypothetical protein
MLRFSAEGNGGAGTKVDTRNFTSVDFVENKKKNLLLGRSYKINKRG